MFCPGRRFAGESARKSLPEFPQNETPRYKTIFVCPELLLENKRTVVLLYTAQFVQFSAFMYNLYFWAIQFSEVLLTTTPFCFNLLSCLAAGL